MASRHSMQPPRDLREFKIAVICALTLEADMVEKILDIDWEEEGYTYQKAVGDSNTYTCGNIAGKNVVLAYCSTIGSNNAAQVVGGLRSSFTEIKFAFVVGICGAAPYDAARKEIVLGDCIMSTAVVQFDLGRRGPEGFRRKDGLDGLGRVGTELGSMLAKLRTQKHAQLLERNLEFHLQALQRKYPGETTYPGSREDRLFQPTYIHNHRSGDKVCADCDTIVGICGKNCEELRCQDEQLVQRQRFTENMHFNLPPAIHFGTFGSSNTVLKCGEERDKVAKTNNIIAFEMEASGVWDMFPTVIIKSASDYADSHKTKRWQPYAAAVAAAGLKAFLQQLQLPDDMSLSTSITIGSRFSKSSLSIDPINGYEAYPADRELYRHPQIYHNEYQSEVISSISTRHATYDRGFYSRAQNARIAQTVDLQKMSANARSLEGVFDICIHTLEQLETCETSDATSTQSFLRVKNVRRKLHEWAFSVGIKGDVPMKEFHHELQSDETYRIIKTILSLMSESLTNMDHLSSKSLGTIMQGGDKHPGSRETSKADDIGNALDSTTSTRLVSIPTDQRAFTKVVKQLEDFAWKLSTLVNPLQPNSMGGNSMVVSGLNAGLSVDHLNMDENLQKMLRERQNSARIEIRRRIDQSLNPPKLQDELPKHTSDRLASTCDWIFLDPMFCKWNSTQPNPMKAKFLWLYGPAGFGKTILCSRITEYFQNAHSSYVFYHFSRLHAQSGGVPEDVIRAWILQIAESDDGNLNLVGSCLSRKASGWILHSLDVWSIFTQIVSRLDRCIFILDGLDEYSRPDTDLHEFLGRLKESLYMSSSMFVLTSRDIPEIRSQMTLKTSTPEGPYLFSHEITKSDTQSDISLFARYVVDKKLAAKDSALKRNLASRMADRCDGMFLWLAITGTDLRGHQSKSRLVEAVDRAPDLRTAYERNWKNILAQSDDENPQGLRILKWCIFSIRPLTVYELTIALAIQSLNELDGFSSDDLPDPISDEYIDSEIKEPCGSLVEVKSSEATDSPAQKIVQLTHLSVKEYLLPSRLKSSQHSPIEESKCHLELAEICLRYLCSTNVTATQEKGNRFQEYATENWLKHKRQSQLDDLSFHHLVTKYFDTNNDNFNSWAKTFEKQNWTNELFPYDYDGSFSPVYLVSLLGFEQALEILLRQDASSVNSIGGAHGTPLQAACAEGHESIVSILLNSGADVKVKAGDLGSALGTSAHYGRYKFVLDLLERGAEIDEKGSGTVTPLYAAALNGHADVIRLLLDRGASIETTNQHSFTPLNAAAYNGHLEVVRLLIERGATKETPNKNGLTPLYSAAKNGHVDILRLLLDKGPKVDASMSNGWTPLNAASEAGHLEAVRLLLGAGADVEMPDNNRQTPLYSAAWRGHIDILRLLLDRRPNLETALLNGDTPLNAASTSGHLDVVHLLLDRGANMETPDSKGWTPLNAASSKGHLEVVRLLLDRKANIETPNDEGWTPLNSASDGGYLETVRLLLDRKANMETVNNNGVTPLLSASSSGHLEVVRLLLDRRADLEMVNNGGFTSLHSASTSGHLEVVRLLLDRKANMETANNDGFTPLNAASSNGHLDVVRLLLLDRDVSVETPNHGGRTPLCSAAMGNHIEIMRLLLSKGANIDKPTDYGWTPINIASMNGYLEAVRLLLDRKANMETPSSSGFTPLHTASAYGRPEVAELLLQRGASLTALNNVGELPLFCAVSAGYLEVVKVFDRFVKGADMAVGGSKSQAEEIFFSHNDHQGRNIFHYAARYGDVELLEYLLQGRLLLDTKDKFGRNVLDYASMSESLEMVEKILELYIRGGISPASSSQWSALHWACRNGSREIVESLTKAQSWHWMVETDIPAAQWSPLDIAIYWKNPKLKVDDEGLLSILRSERDRNSNYSSTDSLRLNSMDYSYKAFGGTCDGCFSSIVGWCFNCQSCPDFYYCFMCKHNSDLAHPDHLWESTKPRTEDWDA